MKKKSIFIMMLMSVILSSVSFPAYAATDSFGNKLTGRKIMDMKMQLDQRF